MPGIGLGLTLGFCPSAKAGLVKAVVRVRMFVECFSVWGVDFGCISLEGSFYVKKLFFLYKGVFLKKELSSLIRNNFNGKEKGTAFLERIFLGTSIMPRAPNTNTPLGHFN